MGKKGLSREEKLARLQELLHESKTAMTLKELETRCYKEKGIVAQTVKEIAAELSADNLIFCEKVGSSNYYWSFPSQALVTRRNKKEALTASLEGKKRRREELVEAEEQLTSERDDDNGERTQKLAKLAELQAEEEKLDEEFRLLSANDPELLEAIRRDTKIAKEAVERWTDNLFQLKKICADRGITEEQFDAGFETAEMCYED